MGSLGRLALVLFSSALTSGARTASSGGNWHHLTISAGGLPVSSVPAHTVVNLHNECRVAWKSVSPSLASLASLAMRR